MVRLGIEATIPATMPRFYWIRRATRLKLSFIVRIRSGRTTVRYRRNL